MNSIKTKTTKNLMVNKKAISGIIPSIDNQTMNLNLDLI